MVDVNERPAADAADEAYDGEHSEAWAVVVAVNGDLATVRVEDSGCGQCSAPGGCGGRLLARPACDARRTYRVVNGTGRVAGERVRVLLPARSVRRSAFAAYAYPLLALLGGALAGSELGGETGALAGALLGLGLGWLHLWRAEWRWRGDASLRPSIRR